MYSLCITVVTSLITSRHQALLITSLPGNSLNNHQEKGMLLLGLRTNGDFPISSSDDDRFVAEVYMEKVYFP